MLTYSHHIFIKYEVHLTELCRVLLKLSSTIFLNECLPSSQKRENILISSFLQYTGDAFDRSDTSRFLFSQIIFAVISRLTDVCLLQIFFKLLFSHYLFDWLEKNLHLSNYYCSTLRIVNWGGLLRLFKDDSTSTQCLKTTKIFTYQLHFFFCRVKVVNRSHFVRWDLLVDFKILWLIIFT